METDVTFGCRGDSFTPRYNAGSPKFGLWGATTPSILADASAIGGQVWDFDTGTFFQNHGVHYSGIDNWPATPAVSILVRAKFSAFGTNQGLWNCGGGCRANAGQLSSFFHGGTGEVRAYMRDASSGAGINNASFGVHALSVDTWYDMLWTYTGDDSTDGFELFIDGTSFGTLTSSRAWDNPRSQVFNDLAYQLSENINTGRWFVNETVIWSKVVDPTSVSIGGSTGTLEGASRTDFVDVPIFDGSQSGGTTLKLL